MRAYELSERLFDALRFLPGATELHLFGSLASGNADVYSDVDLQVVTQDLRVSRTALLSVLEGVGPISLDWAMTEPSGESLSTILFSHESCYHKLDIGLSEIFRLGDPAALFLGPSRMVWRIEPPISQTEWEPIQTYSPEEGSAAHFVVGLLLAGVRYVKARKRGKDWTCWRFVSAQIDWLATLLYEEAHAWAHLGKKLTTLEYAELDALMEQKTRDTLFAKMDLSSPAAMDAAYCQLLTQTLELSHGKARHAGNVIPPDCVNRLMHFIRSELAQ